MQTVIYHHPCADGFAAAWAIWTLYPEWTFFGGVHGNEPPWDLIEGNDVYLVDFCYKRPVLDAVVGRALSVTVIDHHVTQAEDAQPLLDDGLIAGVFDMEHSGARLAWDYFHEGDGLGIGARPPLIDYIEDRDLWRFRLDGTREIQAAVFSYPYEFELWERMMLRPVAELRAEGEAIERKHMKDVHEFIADNTRYMRINGELVPVVNLPYFYVSEACHLLAQNQPNGWAAAYWDTPKGRVFSLRSTDYGPNVGAIAKRYGGGGHTHAAGFRMPIGWEGDA